MAKIALGSKHGRPAYKVTSTIDNHPKVVDSAGEAFYGTSDKPRFYSERYVPFLVSGNSLSKDDAIKSFAQFIDSLEAVAKSEGVTVKNAEGETIFDGPVPALPLASNGQTAGSYALSMIQRAHVLAHQNDMRAAASERVLEAARKANLLKPNVASTGRRGSTRDNVI